MEPQSILGIGISTIVVLGIISIIVIGLGGPPNPKHWWCFFFHRKYHKHTGVIHEFTFKCTKCGRHEEWFDYFG